MTGHYLKTLVYIVHTKQSSSSRIDPENMHVKFYVSKLHFHILIGFNVFWKLHEV